MNNRNAKLLPFYIVCDVSHSMLDNNKLEAAQKILPTVVEAIAAEPILSDKVRIGLIDFSDQAEVRMPLCDLLEVIDKTGFPVLSARRATSYAAAFSTLRTTIDADIKLLKADGCLVLRPTVFFLSDGAPSEPADVWQRSFRHLIDDPAYPNIVPFGVGGADGKVLQQLIFPASGDKQMRMYLADEGGNAAMAIERSMQILVSSIVQSGTSSRVGGPSVVLPKLDDLPPGMSSYSANDDLV
jgi:uncharacterized protein YegL